MAKWMGPAGLVWAVCANLAGAAGTPVVLAKARDYPHAGILLAVPEGFEYRALSAPYDVMSTVFKEHGRAVRGVTLTAFPVAGKGTAEEFADMKLTELKKNLAIRNLKPSKKTTMPVAGTTGAARVMSYTFRGDKTVAAQVFFFREVKNAPVRICYLLTVVSSADKQAQLLPVLGAVVKSVRLTAVRHPDVQAAGELGEPIEDAELGYSLRRPNGWYGETSPGGAAMGQIDYLMGGEPMPSVRLIVGATSGDVTTSEACSKMYLAMAKAVATQRKQDYKVTFDGAARLGALPAHQFVIVQSPKTKLPAPRSRDATESVVLVQRTACMAADDAAKPKVYMLILSGRGEETQAPMALMERIAGSFKVIVPATQPTSVPATAPAPRPATSRPANKTATAPAR